MIDIRKNIRKTILESLKEYNLLENINVSNREKAIKKLSFLKRHVKLDDKGESALLRLFMEDSREIKHNGMIIQLLYLKSEDGNVKKYDNEIFCHIVWYNMMFEQSAVYYTIESENTDPLFGLPLGHSLRE